MPTVPGRDRRVPPQALREAGGMSDDTLAEDTDLTMALGRAGWKVVYEERRPRLDRGAGHAGAAVEAALPVELRHHAGDVEAPPRDVDPAPSGRFGRRGLLFLASSGCCCRCSRR